MINTLIGHHHNILIIYNPNLTLQPILPLFSLALLSFFFSFYPFSTTTSFLLFIFSPLFLSSTLVLSFITPRRLYSLWHTQTGCRNIKSKIEINENYAHLSKILSNKKLNTQNILIFLLVKNVNFQIYYVDMKSDFAAALEKFITHCKYGLFSH